MESSLSLETFMQNQSDALGDDDLLGVQPAKKDRKKDKNKDLEDKIRCVTAECIEKQLTSQFQGLEERVLEQIKLNTTRLRNVWRHHKEGLARVEALEREPTKDVTSRIRL